MDDDFPSTDGPRGLVARVLRRSMAPRTALGAAYGGFVFVLTVVCVVGTLAAFIFSLSQPTGHGAVFATAVMLGAAALLCGGLVGFLFALPRSVTVTGVGPDGGGQITVRPNTNLEDISDWLTKIVVGLTLVQVNRIPGALSDLFASAGDALSSAASGKAFAGCLLVYCAVNGTIAGWIGTRLFLGRLMQVSDRPVREAARQAASEGRAETADQLITEADRRRQDLRPAPDRDPVGVAPIA